MKASGKISYRCAIIIFLGSTNIALCGNAPEDLDNKNNRLKLIKESAQLKAELKDVVSLQTNIFIKIIEELKAERLQAKQEREMQLEAEKQKTKRELEMRLEAERQRDEQLQYTMGSGVLLLLFSTCTVIYLNRKPKKNIQLGGITPKDKVVKGVTDFVMKIDDNSLDRLTIGIVERRDKIKLKVGNQKVIVNLIDSIHENDYEKIKHLQRIIETKLVHQNSLDTKLSEGGLGVEEASFQLRLDKLEKELKSRRYDLKILISSIIENISIS